MKENEATWFLVNLIWSCNMLSIENTLAIWQPKTNASVQNAYRSESVCVYQEMHRKLNFGYRNFFWPKIFIYKNNDSKK